MKRPNVLLILNDDMGYSDLGCYGGEINTPNLDRLADKGIRYTQFYNTARCSPSRASLLTGLHPHQCGIGVLTSDTGPEGYQDELNNRCATMAEVLGASGYRTYMSGKWHLAKDFVNVSDTWPNKRGFEEHYGTIPGAGSYFYPNTLVRNNENIEHEAFDDESFYYTDAISDNAVAFLRRHSEESPDQPFFLYTAYTAPHWPLHAREADIKKYSGRYDDGWDELRSRRIQRMRELGILDDSWALSPRDPGQPPWSQTPDKSWQARRMEVYAAQITVMDEGIGRIVDALRETGELGNTLIMFLSDNGGCAEEIEMESADRLEKGTIGRSRTRAGIPVRGGNDPTIDPGPEDTYTSYGVPWANLSNTPFKMYKHWTHEGGIATPFIVHWPGGITVPTGDLNHTPAQLPDVMATVLEITGADYPERLNGNVILPLEGESFLPTFRGEECKRGPLFFEHEGNAAVRDGRWKLVKNFTGATSATRGSDPENLRGNWELYAMETDRTELHDLADRNPEIVKRLSDEFEQWATRCGVKDREKILEFRKTKKKTG